MQESTKPQTKECPECQNILPVHDGFVTWCDRCGWNVNPQKSDKPKGVFDSIYAKLGQKQSRTLLERYLNAEALKPSFSSSRLLAFAFSAIIHGITLFFAGGGIGLIILGWPNLFAITGGLISIGVAWVLRPHIPKLSDSIVCRKDFPALYRLVDSIASSLEAGEINGIVINEEFSAAFVQVGWKGKRVLILGLPFWSILDNQERVALIAHELAHSVNGDATRGFFIGTAIMTLGEWYALLNPTRIWSPSSGIRGFGGEISKIFMYSLAMLVWLGAYLLCLLLWREAQRAEYLADYLAASISGTEAELTLLRKSHLYRTFEVVVRRVTLNKDESCDFFEEFQETVAKVPERELERIRRVEQLENSRLDVTHPPTVNRIELLRAHYVTEPKVQASLSDFNQIENELLPIIDNIQKKLIDMYRAHLYFR